jgi:5-formyltetrahydrofolate cyclo-ligase
MNILSQTKHDLRQRVHKNMRSLTSQYKIEAGIQIAHHIDQWLSTLTIELFHRRVALFKSFSDEISTDALENILKKYSILPSWPILNNHQNMKFEPDGFFDIIFIPGLAFDLHGHRLGRGHGYYDRYLSGLDHYRVRPILVGLCLDEQLFESVPIEEHDVVMDFICTPLHGVQKATCE